MAIGNPCPKHKPRNSAVIKEIKKIDHCEICGATNVTLEVMHIISKGAGGPDIPENLLRGCGPASMQMGCHGKAHKGLISREKLFKIAGRREDIDAEECHKRVRRKMGYDV